MKKQRRGVIRKVKKVIYQALNTRTPRLTMANAKRKKKKKEKSKSRRHK